MTNHELRNSVIRYWQVITVVGFGLIGWGSLHTKVSALESAVASEQTETKDQERKRVEVEKTLVKVEANQAALSDDVDEIKEDIKEQGVKLDKILERLTGE